MLMLIAIIAIAITIVIAIKTIGVALRLIVGIALLPFPKRKSDKVLVRTIVKRGLFSTKTYRVYRIIK